MDITCSKCGKEKQESEFHYKNKKRGKRRSICKLCWSIYHRQHYLDNKDRYRSKASARKKVVITENRKLLLEYFANHSCVLCGEADPIVLEFHHNQGEKDKNIAAMMPYCSWGVILEEIEKCEVVCANCHRRKHNSNRFAEVT